MKIRLLLILFFLPLGGCRTPLLPQINKRHAQFGVQAPESQWQQKSFRGADLYFEHKDQQARIFWHAQCEQFSDSPLEALTAQMLVGFSDIEIKEESRAKIAGREALISSIEAKIDGMPRFLKIFVLRKNRCVFDGVFSAPPASQALSADFDKMANSFWAEASL